MIWRYRQITTVAGVVYFFSSQIGGISGRIAAGGYFVGSGFRFLFFNPSLPQTADLNLFSVTMLYSNNRTTRTTVLVLRRSTVAVTIRYCIQYLNMTNVPAMGFTICQYRNNNVHVKMRKFYTGNRLRPTRCIIRFRIKAVRYLSISYNLYHHSAGWKKWINK